MRDQLQLVGRGVVGRGGRRIDVSHHASLSLSLARLRASRRAGVAR